MGGNSCSEFNIVIIFLRFIKWNLSYVTDIFLVIFTMIQNMILNNTVKCLDRYLDELSRMSAGLIRNITAMVGF